MNKKYQFSDFNDNQAWLIFRFDTFVKSGPIDIYVVMDLPSGMILTHEITATELSQKQVDSLVEKSLFKARETPGQILLAANDPIELLLQKSIKNLQTHIKIVSSASLEDLTEEVSRGFSEKMVGAHTLQHRNPDDGADALDHECAKKSIPDSYDLCSCASGLKYKFCCKRIFMEVIDAMCCTEDGNFAEALDWIAKARALIGNTSEVLCRESIVYSFFNPKKSKELLNQCLAINPKHPRAHYIQAIALKAQGDFQGAIAAYERAISYYPTTDHFHLNEARNNLGVLYYEIGDFAKAKSEFELALHLMPSDKLTRMNLQDLIYSREKPVFK